MPSKHMGCFKLLLEHLAWIEHQFLSGIRDSRKSVKADERCGRSKDINTPELIAQRVRVRVRLTMLRFKGVQEEIPLGEACTLQIGSMAFPPGQYTSPQFHPCRRQFDQDGIKTVPQPLYSPDLAPCDFRLFPKLRSCRYETIEEMKEAVTKVIDTLKQGDFHVAFQELLEWYNKCIAAGGDYFEGD